MIDELLAAGSEPPNSRACANIALPYLAENWFDDLGVRGDEQRRLSLLLLEKGVDLKTISLLA